MVEQYNIDRKAYLPAINIIKETIRSYGGKIHQKDFDKEFGYKILHNRIMTRGKIFPPLPSWLNASMLGGFGGGIWAKWLDLTQIMVAGGELYTEGDTPNLFYCINEEYTDG